MPRTSSLKTDGAAKLRSKARNGTEYFFRVKFFARRQYKTRALRRTRRTSYVCRVLSAVSRVPVCRCLRNLRWKSPRACGGSWLSYTRTAVVRPFFFFSPLTLVTYYCCTFFENWLYAYRTLYDNSTNMTLPFFVFFSLFYLPPDWLGNYHMAPLHTAVYITRY